jgi:hypothetical protein
VHVFGVVDPDGRVRRVDQITRELATDSALG